MFKKASPTQQEIRDRRADSGLSQAGTAALIYSTRRTWQDWEAGVASMRPGLWELFELKRPRPKPKVEQLEEQAQAALISRVEEEVKRKQAVADEADEKKQMQQASPVGKVAKFEAGARDIEILTPSAMSEFLDNIFRMDGGFRSEANRQTSQRHIR